MIVNHKLTEKTKYPFQTTKLRDKLFFRQGDEICYKLASHIEYMQENGISAMDLWLSKREINAPYFYCRKFEQAGEKSDSMCGKYCEAYTARNGKSGACKHYGYTYEQTDRIFTLEIA